MMYATITYINIEPDRMISTSSWLSGDGSDLLVTSSNGGVVQAYINWNNDTGSWRVDLKGNGALDYASTVKTALDVQLNGNGAIYEIEEGDYAQPQ